MNISPDEARDALGIVGQYAGKTEPVRAAMAYVQIVWGLIWFVGFLVGQFVPSSLTAWFWVPLIIAGCTASAVLSTYRGVRVYNRAEQQSNIAGAIVYGYGLLWFLITGPHAAAQAALLWIMFSMFSFIVGGIQKRMHIWIGVWLAVTVLALVGYYALPGMFWLWAAVFCGLPLLGFGMYSLYRIRKV